MLFGGENRKDLSQRFAATRHKNWLPCFAHRCKYGAARGPKLRDRYFFHRVNIPSAFKAFIAGAWLGSQTHLCNLTSYLCPRFITILS